MLSKAELLKALKVIHVNGQQAPTLFIPRDVFMRYSAAAFRKERIIVVGSPEETVAEAQEALDAQARDREAGLPPPPPCELTQGIIEEVMEAAGVNHGVIYLEPYDIYRDYVPQDGGNLQPMDSQPSQPSGK